MARVLRRGAILRQDTTPAPSTWTGQASPQKEGRMVSLPAMVARASFGPDSARGQLRRGSRHRASCRSLHRVLAEVLAPQRGVGLLRVVADPGASVDERTQPAV